jgi:hypothetical protein
VWLLSATTTNGLVSLLGQTNLMFTPATNFNGMAWISYTNTDGLDGEAGGVFTVTVTPVNDPPEALHGYRFVPENQPTLLEPLENDFDPDGDALSVISAVCTNGSVSIFGGTNLLYVPATNYLGVHWVIYTISDGHGMTATAGVNVDVAHVNRPPVAQDDSASTPEDVPVLLAPLVNDTDEEDGQPVIVLASAPIGSVVNLGGTNLLFTPPTNFHGLITLAYLVADSAGLTNGAAITVTVSPVNDPPVPGADFAETCRNFALAIPAAVLLANDQNVDGTGALSLTNCGPVSTAGGEVLVAAGQCVYSPPTNYTGLDVFTYTVVTPAGDAATGTVIVRVGSPLYLLSIAAQTNGAMLIRVCGERGSNYVMQATGDFLNWTNLGGLAEGALGGLQFEDHETNAPWRGYRVMSP